LTDWDAAAYDRTSQPQQSWAEDVLARIGDLPPGAVILDVGCGTGRVTEALTELGRVLAIDASTAMVARARERLGDHAEVWQRDVLELDVPEPVDLVVSTATLHWVPDHHLLWKRLAAALKPGGRLEVQCGGRGNIARVCEAIEQAAPELAGWSPWTFAGPEETTERLRAAGFTDIRAWLTEKPTHPEDVAAFVRTSILPAHLERLPPGQRDAFAEAVVARVELPLDYVRLNVSAVRSRAGGSGTSRASWRRPRRRR
jgi:trans-aconitate 2-methyltransferase